MIILDTNVLSEFTRQRPDPKVVAFVDAVAPGAACITAITCAEIRVGIERKPRGRERDLLEAAWTAVLSQEFARRILPFDGKAAFCFGALFAWRRSVGRPFATEDGQILAIALAHNAVIATRDREGFRDSGVDIFDPWADNPPTTP